MLAVMSSKTPRSDEQVSAAPMSGVLTNASQDRPKAVPEAGKKSHMQEGHSLRNDHAQQPADLVARRVQRRMQSITDFSLGVTTIHAVIRLEVADDGLNRLSSLEKPPLLLAVSFALAPVHDSRARVVRLHPP